MSDALTRVLQARGHRVPRMERVGVVTVNPLTVRLPDGAVVTAVEIAGLTYTAGGAAVILRAEPGSPIAFPVAGSAPTAQPAPAAVTVSAGGGGSIDTTPTPNVGPTAAFTVTVAADGLTVTVDSSSSIDPDGTIAARSWDWGDGTNTTGVTSTHTYVAGSYSIVLTVTDNSAATDTATVPVKVAAPASSSSTQPSGAGIVAYQSLTGSKFSTRVNSAGTGTLVSFPAGTFTFSDFSDGTQTISLGAFAFGADITAHGLLGSGQGKTILQMVPYSSTKAGDVPTGNGTGGTSQPTNNLQYIRIRGTGAKVDGLTIQGTSQGHLYNGLRFEAVTNPTLTNTTIAAMPGNSSANPGETFHVNFQRAAGTATITNVTVDGGSVGAAGLASNSASAHFIIRNLTTTNLRYSAGFASWQQTGPMDFYNWRNLNGPRAFGAERLAAAATFYDPQWATPGSGHDITYTWDTGYTGGSIIFRFTSTANVPTRKYGILTNSSSTSLGIKNSVKVYVAGVLKTTTDYITWV